MQQIPLEQIALVRGRQRAEALVAIRLEALAHFTAEREIRLRAERDVLDGFPHAARSASVGQVAVILVVSERLEWGWGRGSRGPTHEARGQHGEPGQRAQRQPGHQPGHQPRHTPRRGRGERASEAHEGRY
jgi:hypothetical protein